MSKIKLTGSNSGYVEISSAADAGNLTLQLPTAGTALLSNTGNVFSGITTTGQLDINGSIDVSSTSVFNDDVTFTGASYNVLWDKSDNQLEFGNNAKLSFGSSSDLQVSFDSANSLIAMNTGSLSIINYANNEDVKILSDNGSGGVTNYIIADGGTGEVLLHHYGNEKFKTTNTGAVVTGICTATSFSGSGEGLTRTTQLSHRNIIINGDFKIAQRATSHGSSGYRTVDRFKMNAGGASHALTQAQVDVASGTTPYTEGFRKAYSITNAGQNANNQAYTYMQYSVEAQDLATSGWNYTNPNSFITISFWIKASVTQTYLFFLHTNDGGTKEYNHLMSLSANTWTKITLNVPGNSGLQFDNNNGLGLNIYWTAYLGDHYTSTGSVDQWVTHAGYTSRPDMGSTWWTTSNATFQLTGVQLEVGEQATPFEHLSFGEQLLRCQRYYEIVSPTGGVACWSWGGTVGSTNVFWKVKKRTAPSVGYNGTLTNNPNNANGQIGVYSHNNGWNDWGTLTMQESTLDSVRITFSGMNESWSGGDSIGIYFYGQDSNIYGDAEI